MGWHLPVGIAMGVLVAIAGNGCSHRSFVAGFANINAPLLLNQHPTYLAGEASVVEWREIGKLEAKKKDAGHPPEGRMQRMQDTHLRGCRTPT